MRRWKVWLASNAHNCCPKDTKHEWVIVITLSHGVWRNDGGHKGNGTNYWITMDWTCTCCQSHDDCDASSVAEGRTVTFWSQDSFFFCGSIAIRTIHSVSESCFHICRLGRRKIPHECAGSAAPGQSNTLQLTYHLRSKSSSFIRVIHFISQLLPLQKPKWSLLKPTCSLLPQSKRLSFDLSFFHCPVGLFTLHWEAGLGKWNRPQAQSRGLAVGLMIIVDGWGWFPNLISSLAGIKLFLFFLNIS